MHDTTTQDMLSPRGVFYMVVVIENKPKDIAAILARDGFEMTVTDISFSTKTVNFWPMNVG